MTEPPFPARQAVRTQRPKRGKPPKIVNGVAYHGFKQEKHAPPRVARHSLTPGAAK